jgi:hypothetical protein
LVPSPSAVASTILAPPHVLARAIAIRHDAFKPGTIGRAHVYADVIPSHDRCLTDLRSEGNLLLDTEH